MAKKSFLLPLALALLFLCSLIQLVSAQTLSGRVYEGATGTEPPTATALSGVTVKLIGTNDVAEDPTTTGTLITSTTTDAQGWYGLDVSGAFDFYNIVEENPSGYNSDGATTVGGTVKTADWIQYGYIDLSGTTTGNKFWDKKEGVQNNPPVADADGPYNGFVNQPVTFDGSGSYDPDTGDSITTYEWDMDYDGQYDDATGVNPTWTWNAPTTTIVGLKVTDTHGATDTDSSLVTIDAQAEYDFGDAPDPSYPTLLASNGARHQIDPDVFLGSKIDADTDGQQNSDASGDDSDGNDDEDGVVFKSAFVSGSMAYFDVTVSRDGFLGVWVDFNGNGSFADAGESAFNSDTSVVAGVNQWGIFVPSNAKPGNTFARFRYSTHQGLTIDGLFADGEVEDYQVTIEAPDYDYGDAPDPSYPTLQASNGARHQIDPDVFLGSSIDADADGQPNSDATGDDNDGADDEDGVVFKSAFVPGAWARFDITASRDGNLGIWVDFNGNGSFADAGESAFNTDTMVVAGVSQWGIFVPVNAVPGKTFARFRYSTHRGLTIDGAFADGEVEDYQIEIAGGEETASVGDLVWDDADHDGIQDGGETGLANVTVTLYNSQGNSIASTQTDAAGNYEFSGLAARNYTLGFTLPAGFVFSPADQGADDTKDSDANQSTGKTVQFALSAGEHNSYMDAGMYRSGEGDQYDFGDAPDPTYPTLLANNGARHVVQQGFYLGSMIDSEADGQPTALSDGDNNTASNDEDGVLMSPFIAPGQAVPITIVASSSGVVNAWIDFNIDGDWADSGEHVISAMPVNGGGNAFTINVPAGAHKGLTYARFRFSSVRQLSYDGAAPDGEVEDYAIEIKDRENGSIKVIKDATPKDNTSFWFCAGLKSGFLNIICFPLRDPVNNSVLFLNPSDVIDISESTVPGWSLTGITVTGDTDNGSTIDMNTGTVTLDFDDGENIVITFRNKKEGHQDELDFGDAPPQYPSASHFLGGPWEGSFSNKPDAEPGMQHEPHALGDDNDGFDDEDGLHVQNGYIVKGPGLSWVFVDFFTGANGNGKVNLWIDFNGDGDWNDLGEDLGAFSFVGFPPYSSGSIGWGITPPANTIIGTTFARCRISDNPNAAMSPAGAGGPGEVADYEIEIWSDGPTFPPGAIIHGYKWHDLNGDGVRNPGEPPLAGWKVWLDLNHNGVQDGGEPETHTDPFGHFVFPGLNAGTYDVHEALPANWTQTYPGSPNFHTVTVAPNQPSMGLLFGNKNNSGLDELDFGDAPLPYFQSSYASINQNIKLGQKVDAESSAQPDPHALGDDHNGIDDEDGITFITPLLPGQAASVKVDLSAISTNSPLNLWAYIDFNADGDWSDIGEEIINQSVTGGANQTFTFTVPPLATFGPTFARFYLLDTGPVPPNGAPYGEVEDYEIELGEDGEGPPIKWMQIPLMNEDPDMPYTPYFLGWDVKTLYDGTFVADDWFCKSPRPVTEIHWWGSYTDWDEPVPPPIAPFAFHIGVWTDVPAGEDKDYSHPGEMIWQWVVPREMLEEHVVGDDFHPEFMSKPDSCFEYAFIIPPDQWFHQQSDSAIYWLSIAAMYEEVPDEFVWGWKTREHFFHDDAVYVYEPVRPTIGDVALESEPINYGWDMAFVLGTDEYFMEFDFGDAPAERYPTFLGQNGALHIFDPRVYLGDQIDAEEDGQPDELASGDDNDGSDDDDGVLLKSGLIPGQAAEIEVTASTNGLLNAWMDFNNNGSWADADEQVFLDEPLNAGPNLLAFPIPDDAYEGSACARFRFSKEAHLSFIGLAINGEVEDYLFDIGVIDKVNKSDVAPKDFRLYQNYPNPFNSKTVIPYDVVKYCHVELTVYDIMGHEIQKLINANMQAGRRQVSFDASRLTSGIYYYHIKMGSFSMTRKMIYLR